jgi:hypothetical protein
VLATIVARLPPYVVKTKTNAKRLRNASRAADAMGKILAEQEQSEDLKLRGRELTIVATRLMRAAEEMGGVMR